MTAAPTRLPADPAQGAAQLLARLGLALLAVGVPCASVGSRRLIFSLMPVGAALVLIGALLAPSRDLNRQWRAVLLTPTSLTAIFLIGWMGLSLVWAPYVSTGAERFFKTAGTAGLAAVAVAFLPTRTKTSNLYLFPIGVGAAAVATLIVALLVPANSPFRGADLEGSTIERSAIGLIMLMWPALGALAVRERWTSAAAVAIAVGAAVIAVWTPVAMAALALGAVTFALAVSWTRPTARALAGIALALFALAPLLAWAGGLVLARSQIDPQGMLAALPVWADIVRSEGLRLLTGHGLDTASRGMSNGFLPPGAPHSLLFEVWYDLGVVGALASGILAARAFLTAAGATQPLAPFLLAALVSGLTIAISGLSTAQLWWITLIAVVGLAFSVVIKGQYRTERPRVSVSDPARLSHA